MKNNVYRQVSINAVRKSAVPFGSGAFISILKRSRTLHDPCRPEAFAAGGEAAVVAVVVVRFAEVAAAAVDAG